MALQEIRRYQVYRVQRPPRRGVMARLRRALRLARHRSLTAL